MESINTTTPEFLTTKEVCKLLHVSVATIWRFRASFPAPIRIGTGKNLYRKKDIDKWADEQQAAAAAALCQTTKVA